MHPDIAALARRERQVFDAVERLGRSTVAEIVAEVDATYDAVRSVLRLLREKGLVKVEHEGKRYVYGTSIPKAKLRRSAMEHVVDTFFGGSQGQAMLALLEMPDVSLTRDELKRIGELIRRTKASETAP